MNDTYKTLIGSATSRWDKFWYTIVWWLGSLQTLVLSYCIKQPVWRSMNGRVHTPATMSRSHLLNSIRYCERNGQFDESYAAMLREADRRGLKEALGEAS